MSNVMEKMERRNQTDKIAHLRSVVTSYNTRGLVLDQHLAQDIKDMLTELMNRNVLDDYIDELEDNIKKQQEHEKRPKEKFFRRKTRETQSRILFVIERIRELRDFEKMF